MIQKKAFHNIIKYYPHLISTWGIQHKNSRPMNRFYWSDKDIDGTDHRFYISAIFCNDSQ